MSAQLPLFGGLPTRPVAHGTRAQRGMHMDRVVYFFAVLPPDELRPHLAHLRNAVVAHERIVGRPAALDRLHISIAPLASFERGEPLPSAGRVEALAARIAARVTMRAFDVCFDGVQTFNTRESDASNRRYFLVLCGSDLPGLTQLNDLFRQSRTSMAAATAKPFNPHMTLFYANRPIAPCDIAPIKWTVRDVALVQSFQGEGRHVILRRWPLLELVDPRPSGRMSACADGGGRAEGWRR